MEISHRHHNLANVIVHIVQLYLRATVSRSNCKTFYSQLKTLLEVAPPVVHTRERGSRTNLALW